MGGYHVSVPESRNNEEELAGSRELNYKQRGQSTILWTAGQGKSRGLNDGLCRCAFYFSAC
jgi:hypothetical protein